MAKNDETIDMIDSTPSKKPINKWVIISVVLALLVVGGLSVNAVLNKNKDSASIETVKTTDKPIAASSIKETTPTTKTNDTSTPTVALVEEPIKGTFQFGFDDYSLSQTEMSKVQSYWSNIQGKEGSVDVIGYSDNVGAEGYNLTLSVKRAQAVAEALTKAGMGEKFKVTSNGLGIANPVADNSTEEGRTKNRRVEIIFKIIK
jgi:outer membrane protein OmpA-like peptidoglycan-associated protein